MKTLKQLLDERDVDSELAIHAVKEWLTQKRQEIDWSNCYYCVPWKELIDKFLKDLEE